MEVGARICVLMFVHAPPTPPAMNNGAKRRCTVEKKTKDILDDNTQNVGDWVGRWFALHSACMDGVPGGACADCSKALKEREVPPKALPK